MNRRAFVGFGELGRQVLALVSAGQREAENLFFDDACAADRMTGAIAFKEHVLAEYADCTFYVCLGYRWLAKKMEIVEHLTRLGRDVPAFCHPTAFRNATAHLGEGSMVYPMCNLDKDVEIGKGVLLNNSVTVSHNSRIGDGSFMSPGVVVCGSAEIGRRVFVGAGAVISNGVAIGDDAIIGLGTVVSRDVPEGASAIGSPMRILRQPLRLQ